MREILRSIYTNEIILILENLGEILHAASLMQLEGVINTATSYTEKVIDITNCFWFRNLMSKQPCKSIEEVMNCYFQQNIEKVSALPEYTNLSFGELNTFFSSDDLKVANEKIVFELLLNWINEDQESRKERIYLLCASNKQILLYKDAKKGKQCSSSAISSNIPEGNILLPFAQQFYINPIMTIQRT